MRNSLRDDLLNRSRALQVSARPGPTESIYTHAMEDAHARLDHARRNRPLPKPKKHRAVRPRLQPTVHGNEVRH